MSHSTSGTDRRTVRWGEIVNMEIWKSFFLPARAVSDGGSASCSRPYGRKIFKFFRVQNAEHAIRNIHPTVITSNWHCGDMPYPRVSKNPTTNHWDYRPQRRLKNGSILHAPLCGSSWSRSCFSELRFAVGHMIPLWQNE